MSKPTDSLNDVLVSGSIQNPYNYTISLLQRELNNFLELEDRDYSVIQRITNILRSNGQKIFAHLSPAFQEANCAIALNCGNGIVAKIIPYEFTDKLPDVTNSGFGRAPLLLPSIFSIETKANGPIPKFKIKFYPYIANNRIDAKDVEDFGRQVAEFGLRIRDKDNRPINFRKLADKNSTVVAIDSDMFEIVDIEKFKSSGPAIDKWMKHLKEIYPIYESKILPVQQVGFVFREGLDLAPASARFLDFSFKDDEKSKNMVDAVVKKKKTILNMMGF